MTNEVEWRGVLILASESLSCKKLPTFEDRPTVLVKTPVIDRGEVWKRGFGVRRVLRGKVLVYDVNALEGCHSSASGTMVSQVHFLFGVHLMPFLPVGYQRTETVNPFQSDNARIGLICVRIIPANQETAHLEPHNMASDHE